MRKLFMIAILGLTMISCDNTPTEVKNPKEVTTVELQQLASIDSVTYKVVEKNDTVYILSTKDNMVVKKVANESGEVVALLVAICLILVIFWIVLIIIND
jgi:hypothetical protein